MKKTFGIFRRIAWWEGVSLLVLLGIAMPLKYFAGFPLAVTIIGSLHGILFVAFAVMAWEVKTGYRKSWLWLAKAMLAAFIPFGTFLMEKEWKKEEMTAAS